MILDRIALTLAIIGGLNWGSIGLFRFDLVAYLFGGQTATLSRVIYTLVGLAAVWCISLLFRREQLVESDGSAVYSFKLSFRLKSLEVLSDCDLRYSVLLAELGYFNSATFMYLCNDFFASCFGRVFHNTLLYALLSLL